MTTINQTSSSKHSSPTAAASLTGRQRALRELRRMGPVLGVLVLLLIALAVFVPTFYGPANLANVAQQSAQVGVVSVGMTFVIITAGIDLSVGSVMAGSSVLSGFLLTGHVPGFVVILACLAVGAVCGGLNALLVSRMRIQPFVATLATSAIIGGLVMQSTNGTQLQVSLITDPLLTFMGSGSVVGIPGPFIIFLGVALIAGGILRYTAFGRYVYAVGGSQEAARLSGIPVAPVLYGAYAIAGVTSAIAGLMYTAYLNVGDPTAGSLISLDAIAAVVIGGTSLAGGTGRILGTVFGALLLAVLANVLDLLGVSPFMQQTMKGVVIVLAVIITVIVARRSRK